MPPDTELKAAGCDNVFREVASGAKTARNQLRRALDHLAAGDVLMATRLERLARSNGCSLRFSAAEAYDMPHRPGDELFSQKLRAALEKGREVLITAAQAERERLRQAEELRKTQELTHTLRPRGPSMGR